MMSQVQMPTRRGNAAVCACRHFTVCNALLVCFTGSELHVWRELKSGLGQDKESFDELASGRHAVAEVLLKSHQHRCLLSQQ